MEKEIIAALELLFERATARQIADALEEKGKGSFDVAFTLASIGIVQMQMAQEIVVRDQSDD